jgi:uncharacterized membrane protein YecN with MAPEG domain
MKMITLFYVVAMALFYLGYTWYLIFLKRHAKVAKADWPTRWYDRAEYGRNFIAQYSPFALLLLGAVELSGSSSLTIHLLGLSLITAAIFHVISFGFPAKMKMGKAAMLIVTAMYGAASVIAVAQLTSAN